MFSNNDHLAVVRGCGSLFHPESLVPGEPGRWQTRLVEASTASHELIHTGRPPMSPTNPESGVSDTEIVHVTVEMHEPAQDHTVCGVLEMPQKTLQ